MQKVLVSPLLNRVRFLMMRPHLRLEHLQRMCCAIIEQVALHVRVVFGDLVQG